PSQADSGETRLTHKSRLKPEKVARGFNFEEKACEDALAALTKGEVQIVLQGSKASEVDSTAPSKAAPKVARKQTTSERPQCDDGEAAIPGVPIIRILYRADRDESVAALARMQSSLHRVRAAQRTKLLSAADFPLRPADLSAMNENSLATQRQVTGLALGRSLTLFLLLLILTSGAVVAIDSLAVEQQLRTLKTGLTTVVKVTELLTAKWLVIFAIALLIPLVKPLILLIYARLKLFSLPPSLPAAVPPWIAVLLFLLFLPVAALA